MCFYGADETQSLSLKNFLTFLCFNYFFTLFRFMVRFPTINASLTLTSSPRVLNSFVLVFSSRSLLSLETTGFRLTHFLMAWTNLRKSHDSHSGSVRNKFPLMPANLSRDIETFPLISYSFFIVTSECDSLS